jgi:hypothetical protein
MSPQNDLNIQNASGAAVRADLNNALQALASISAGSSAPSTTYSYQVWLDTSASTTEPTIKQRNQANNAWITIAKISTGGNLLLEGTGAVDIPVGTTAQRPTASQGMLRYNTTTSSFEGYDGSAWGSIGGGASGGGTDTVFYENTMTVTTNYSLPSGSSASSVGPITINSGITVTVPSGSNWVVL